MFTRTSFAAPALILFSLFSINHVASAQNSYHHAIHVQKTSDVPDSVDVSTRLQVSLVQPDKAILKFRISVFNPQGHALSVTIRKGDDIFFSEIASGDQYYNIFNMTQLEDGNYDVTVTGGKERVVRHLHLETATTVDRQISIN